MPQGDQNSCYNTNRRKTYVLRKDRYLLHGRSNTKERKTSAYGRRGGEMKLRERQRDKAKKARRKRDGEKREPRTPGGDSNMGARLT